MYTNIKIGSEKRVAEITSALFAFDPRGNTTYAEQFIHALVLDGEYVADEDTGQYDVYISDEDEIIRRIKPFLHLNGPNLITGLNNYFEAHITADSDFSVQIPSNTSIFPIFDTEFQVFVERLIEISQYNATTKQLKVRHLENGSVISWVSYTYEDGKVKTFTSGGTDLTTSLGALIIVLMEEGH